MAVLETQPRNVDYLSPLGFRLTIDRFPTVSYFSQNVTLPGISLPSVPVENPFTPVQYPGTKIAFDPVNVNFRVDEDMRNWEELVGWMKGLGFPENFDQYSSLIRNPRGIVRDVDSDVFSDATLLILTNKHGANRELRLHDAIPTNLTPLQFTTQDVDVTYIECGLTLAYTYFTFGSSRDGSSV